MVNTFVASLTLLVCTLGRVTATLEPVDMRSSVQLHFLCPATPALLQNPSQVPGVARGPGALPRLSLRLTEG